MAFKFLDEWQNGAAAPAARPHAAASGLEAYKLVAEAGPAPESMAELEELSRITNTPPGVLAMMPEEVRRRQLAAIMAKNPGLMNFARENVVNGAIAVARAREAEEAAEAFRAYSRIKAGGLEEDVDAVLGGDGPFGDGRGGVFQAQRIFPEKGLLPGKRYFDADGLEAEEEEEENLDAPAIGGGEPGGLAQGGLAGPGETGTAGSGQTGKGPDGVIQAEGGPLAGGAAKSLAGPASGIDYLIDPFKNFYNGWLDLARGVVGAGKSVSDLAAGQNSALSRWFQESIKTLEGAEAPTHEPTSFGGRLARDVVRAAPQLIPQIALHIYAGAAASMGFMFSHIYGNDYVRHTEMGISPANAAFAGALDAAVQSSLERAGITALMKTPGLNAFLAEGGKSALARYGAAGLRGGLAEGATEAAQYIPDYLTTYWAQSSLHAKDMDDRLAWTWRQASDARHLLEGAGQALYEGLVGGVLGAGVSLGHYHKNRKSHEPEIRAWLDELEKEAQANVRRLGLEDAMEKARKSLSGMTDPAQRLALARAAIDAESRSAYLTAADLESLMAAEPALEPASLENVLGAPALAISEALENKTALNVDIASLIADSSPLARRFAESLRLAPEGPALGEAMAWSPQVRLDEISRVLNQEDDYADLPQEEARSAAEEEARRLVSQTGRINREITRISRELREAGMTSLEAESNAALLRAHALAWWKRYGLDGSAMLARVSVENARAAQGNNNQNNQNSNSDTNQNNQNNNQDTNQNNNQDGAPRRRVRRGLVELSPSRSLIRLFRDRDPSTFAHEASHIFLQDLLELQSLDEAGLAARLDEEANRLLASDQDFAARLTREMARIRSETGDGPARMRSYASSLLEIAREREEVMKSLAQTDEFGNLAESQSDDYVFEKLRVKSARSLARRARELARQLEALDQARQDLGTFAAAAGLNEEGLANALAASDLAADLSAAGMEAARRSYTSLQERTAEGFLKFLSGGRAPSPALQSAFSRFAQWLSDLWRRYQIARPERLAPELEAAFNRLLAADRDIRVQDEVDALARGELAFINENNLPADDAAKMRSLLAMAQANSLSKARRSIARFEKNFRKTRLREHMRALASDPFWLAAEKGSYSLAEMEAILGPGRAEKLRAAMPKRFAKNAPPLEQSAQEAGFDSAEALAEELHARLVERGESRRRQAEELTEKEWAEKLKSMDEGTSWLNPDLGRYLDASEAAVARLAASLRLESDLEISRWADSSRIPQLTIEAWAQSRVENTPLNQLSHKALMAALRSTLNKRSRLIAEGGAGNLMQALDLAAEARVIYSMMELSAAASKRLAALKKEAAKIARAPAGTFPAAHTEALRQLLEGYRLGSMSAPVDLAYARALPDLVAEIVQEDDISQSLPAFPQWLLFRLHPRSQGAGSRGGVNLNSLTPAQIREVENLLKFLAHSGRSLTTAGKEGEAARLESLIGELSAAMEPLPDRPRGRGRIASFFSDLAHKGAAAVDILLWQARKADGMRDIMGRGETGPLEQVARQVFPAEERVKGWLDKITRAMEPHLERLLQTRDRLYAQYGRSMDIRDADGNPVLPPEAWRKAHGKSRYSPEMIFAMALNLGNKSNISRLLSGYGPDAFSFASLEALFGTRVAAQLLDNETWIPPSRVIRPGLLEEADWRAIQGMWDALALLWPDTRLAHVKLRGFAPEQVAPFPLTIQGKDGKPVTLQGGYYPAAYDPKISDRVAAWSEADDILARNEARYQAPSARDGHTKSRAAQNPGLPILLDLSPISRHVMDSARFIELGGLVRFLDRITSHKTFKSLYRQKFGLEDYAAIRPNLRGLLRTEKLPDMIAELEQKVRKYVVPWGLSWNPNVALLQSTAVFSGMGDIGARPVLSAIKSLVLNPGLRHDIWAASPYMRSRMYNLDQDLVRQTSRFAPDRPARIVIGGKSWSYEDFVDLGMKGIIAVDAAATCSVWLAAYRLKLAELSQNPPPPPAGPAPQSAQNIAEPARYQDAESDDIAAQVEAALYGETDAAERAAQNKDQTASENAAQSDPTAENLDPKVQAWLDEALSQNDQAEETPRPDPIAGMSKKEASQYLFKRVARLEELSMRIRSNQAAAEEWEEIVRLIDEVAALEKRLGFEARRVRDERLNRGENPPQNPNGESGGATLDLNSQNREDSRQPRESGPDSQNSVTLNQDGETSGETSTNQPSSSDPLINPPAGQNSSETSTINLSDSSSETSTTQSDPSGVPLTNQADASARQSLLSRINGLLSRFRRPSGLVDFESAWHNEAARYADIIVKQSNPDFDPSSRSSFLRSRGMMRLFNQFSSAVTLFASRHAYMATAMQKGKLSKGRYARHLAYDYLFPSAFLFLLYGALRDMWDKKANPGQSFAAFFMDQSSMAIPVFGGLASDLAQTSLGMGRGNYRKGDLRVSLDAPVDLLSHNVRTLGRLTDPRPMNKEQKKAAMYALADLASFIARVPVSKVIRKAERGYDQMRRGEGSAFSLLAPKAGK